MLAPAIALGLAIDILDSSSFKPNTSVVPKNCKEWRDISVNTNISWRALNAVTILDPLLTLIKPALFKLLGVKFSGSFWLANLINKGSKVPPPKGVAPNASKCLSTWETMIWPTSAGTSEAFERLDNRTALVDITFVGSTTDPLAQ